MFGQNKREKKAPDDSGASSSPDGSYRYVRPESKEVLYRDAAVESTEDTVRFPRCYVPNAKTVKESRDPKEREEIPNGFFVRAACMCLVCALLGGVVGGGLTATLLYRSDKAESAGPMMGRIPLCPRLPFSMSTIRPLPSCKGIRPCPLRRFTTWPVSRW